MLTGIGAYSEDTDPGAGPSLSNRIDTVCSEFVDLWATIQLLLLEWTIILSQLHSEHPALFLWQARVVVLHLRLLDNLVQVDWLGDIVEFLRLGRASGIMVEWCFVLETESATPVGLAPNYILSDSGESR